MIRMGFKWMVRIVSLIHPVLSCFYPIIPKNLKTILIILFLSCLRPFGCVNFLSCEL